MSIPATPDPSTAATSFQAQGVDPAPAAPEDTTVVLELDGRKYTQADLVKKIRNADGFIETLKAESAENRKVLDEAAKALKAAVGAKEVIAAVQQPAAPAAATAVPDTASVIKAVRDELAAESAAQQQEANWKQCTQAITAVFGASTDAKVKERAAQLGVSVEHLVTQARTAPAMFLALFPETTAQKKTASPFNPSLNSQAVVQPATSTAHKAWADSRTTKDSVAAYTQRLKELSGA